MNLFRQGQSILFAFVLILPWSLLMVRSQANPVLLQLTQKSDRSPLIYNNPNRSASGTRRPPKVIVPRGDCVLPGQPITVLAPSTNWGETTAERPTLWFYVPNSTGRLTLRLEDNRTKSSIGEPVNLEAQGTPGIVSITLPSTMPPLVVGRSYRWRLFLFCDASQSAFRQVNGVIVRRAARANLTGLSPRDRVVRYAADGLWYDALTELALLRRQDPTNPDLKADWTVLLTHPAVRLEDLLEEPIVDCCHP